MPLASSLLPFLLRKTAQNPKGLLRAQTDADYGFHLRIVGNTHPIETDASAFDRSIKCATGVLQLSDRLVLLLDNYINAPPDFFCVHTTMLASSSGFCQDVNPGCHSVP